MSPATTSPVGGAGAVNRVVPKERATAAGRAALPPAARTPPGGRAALAALAALAGTMRLLRIHLRTCSGPLALAVGLPTALACAVAASIESLYPTPAQRLDYAATAGASIPTIAFNGRGYGLSETGGITAYEIGFMGQLLLPLVGALLAVRLTREQEERGLTELLTATRVGRLAPLACATALLALTATATAAAMACGLILIGLPVAGSLWYAAGASACTWFFGGVGLLVAQLCQQARTARLVSLALVSGAFLLRLVLDASQSGAARLTPLGWLAELRAFDDPRPWPLIAYGLGAGVPTAMAAVVARGRDLGAGIIAPRPGPARGRPTGRRMAAGARLALRTSRTSTAAWGTVAVAWALTIGLFSEEMTGVIDANPTMLKAMGLERGSDLMMMLACTIVVGAASAVAVLGGTQLAAEEAEGRLGAVLSAPVPRARLWLGWWAAQLASALGVLGTAGLALGLATRWVTGRPQALDEALSVVAAFAAAVALTGALGAVLAALAPGLAPAAWAAVVWGIVVGFLAEALRLPEWARDLSPAHMVGRLPVEEAQPRIIALQAGLAVLLLAASALVFHRRDLRAG